MGDSSEGVSSAHETHLQKCDSFRFIDDVDSVGDDTASETSALLKSTVNNTYPLTNKVLSNGDQSISSDLLSKPVPPQREGDTCAEDTNGHDDFAEREPVVSLSMILGKQANGFDEVAQIEGSEEDVSSESPGSNSESWCAEDLSDNESSETELARRGDERHQLYENIITSEPEEFRYFGEFQDLKTGRPLNGQSSNLHKELYSSKSRNEDYVGYGENVASYNYTTPRCSGNNNVYTTDTYKNMSSTFRGMSCSRFMTGCGLTTPSMCVPSSAPRQSLSSPIVSGGCNSRQQLPYESTPQPPFGKRLDEPRLRNSAVELLSSTQDGLVSPRGMPKAEPIDVAESITGVAANDAENGKKKKKKKKRNGGGMRGDSDAADKKSPLRDEVNAMAPATYPHSLDAGAPVMDHEQRNKLYRNRNGKKKKSETVIKAREIAGHRGSDDVDTLVGFVEGGRKKVPGGGTQDKKGRRQRQPGRLNGERLEEGEEEEKLQEVHKIEVARQNERKEEVVTEKDEYDLEFTNFEGLVDAEEEMPFEKYIGRRKKVRGPGSTKPASQSVPTPTQSNRGASGRWGTRTFVRPFVRPPPPAPRPPPAKEEFPPLRAPSQSLTKLSWNFQQVQHFLETLYPGEKEKCSFYSDAGRKAHHLPLPTLSS